MVSGKSVCAVKMVSNVVFRSSGSVKKTSMDSNEDATACYEPEIHHVYPL